MELPRLNTNFGTGSHAHPLRTLPSPQALEKQRVRALVARQSIVVSLRGLPCERGTTISDILTPKIRRSLFNERGMHAIDLRLSLAVLQHSSSDSHIVTANHLDLTECWKGLSHAQAMELTMWYHFLHECLQDEVRTSLYDDSVEGLLQNEEAIDEVYLVARILDHLRSKSQRAVDVSFVDLIDRMMGMFHDQFPNEAVAIAINWSHFPGGLSLFLHNFLRMQDCFRHSSTGLCLEVDFDFRYADSVLTATGNITWQLPEVRFLPLADRLYPGQEYRITPFILKDVLSPVSSPGCDDYVDQASYALPQSPLNFRWDPVKQCFKARVPDYGDGKTHIIKTVLKARIVTPFPDNVTFERQSRWNIKLDVAPASTRDMPSSSFSDMAVEHAGLYRDHHMYTPPYDISKDTIHRDSMGSNHEAVLRKTFSDDFNPPFSQKRKVLRPELVHVPLDVKRRHHDIAEASENVSHETNLGDEEERAGLVAQSSCCEADGIRVDVLADVEARKGAAAARRAVRALTPVTGFISRSNAQLVTDRCHVFSSNKLLRDCYRQPQQGDSSMSSPNPNPSSPNDSASNSAVEVDHADLQQQQILCNYQEFSERKLRKDAGLISPISDGERRAFEDIFLEDNEWSPVTDGSVIDMDTLME